MMLLTNFLNKLRLYLTDSGDRSQFSQTREVLSSPIREVTNVISNSTSNKKEALIAESFSRAGSNVPASDTRKQTIPSSATRVKWVDLWRRAGGMIPSPFGPKRVSDALPPSGIHPPSTKTSIANQRPVVDSLSCPYCSSSSFQRRGFRQKKLEKVQLYLCLSCHKTFTPQITKGKHYPLSVMLDAISIYNLGYSLEQTCRIVNERNSKSQILNTKQIQNLNDQNSKKEALIAESFSRAGSNDPTLDTRRWKIPLYGTFVKWSKIWRKAGGTIPSPCGPKRVSSVLPPSGIHLPATKNIVSHIALQPSTLSHWLSETAELCRFSRMREYAIKKFSPKEMVITATLAHRQLYRFRFHRGKCDLMIQEEYQHRKFLPLKEFLEMVPVECPHQYFQEGLRASEAPLTFSKQQMIVRAKQNYATRLAAFVLQSVKERKGRHEALQKFMLANDSVTVATEVPVYITRDDIEHMKTQLGFEIYSRPVIPSVARDLGAGGTASFSASLDSSPSARNDKSNPVPTLSEVANESLPTCQPKLEERSREAEADIAEIASLPKLITGHIDILQIRNGQIHILDYKPNAEKERPIEQLTLYAMALSRLTGLRLFEFKCAWFDEKDYFEFYPLHVLHKTKKAARRRKIRTQEGIYAVNKNEKEIEAVRPIYV